MGFHWPACTASLIPEALMNYGLCRTRIRILLKRLGPCVGPMLHSGIRKIHGLSDHSVRLEACGPDFRVPAGGFCLSGPLSTNPKRIKTVLFFPLATGPLSPILPEGNYGLCRGPQSDLMFQTFVSGPRVRFLQNA